MDIEIRFVEYPQRRFVDRRRKVWLECDGEPHDFRAVRVLGIQRGLGDVTVVAFVCPHCGEDHQSLLFG